MANGNVEIKIKDNSKEILKEFETKLENACIGIGLEAEGFSKDQAPVDTGRLRGSITFATSTKHSSGQNPAEASDYATKGTPEKGKVYIGTNVEYAPMQELNDMNHVVGKAHFLRDAAAQHGDRYKEITKAALQS